MRCAEHVARMGG